MTYFSLNNELNGIEIYFGVKPAQAVIDLLKSNRWRWNGTKKCWYTKQSESALATATVICNGETVEVTRETKPTRTKTPKYSGKISAYITAEEYRAALIEWYTMQNNRRSENWDATDTINYKLGQYEQTGGDVSRYIRQAIIWKSLGGTSEKFDCNGSNSSYFAIWDKLPTIEGLEPTGKEFAATWGYDQTQVTTATHYGRAFGLDVLVTGGFGRGEVMLKRIDANERFSHGCMYFSPNARTQEQIDTINTRAIMFGR